MTVKARQWYRFQSKADEPNAADLYVYDVIGQSFWGEDTVTAKRFVEDLKALPESVDTIRVHINSPGGDVFDAVAINNALRQHRASVEVSIEGLAASAATIVSSAGDTIRIADNAMLMVHNPWSWAMGDSVEMRRIADELDKVRGAIVASYRALGKLSDEEIIALMDAVTWMDAEEAVANGFATEIVTGLRAAAHVDRRFLAKLAPVPDKYRARVDSLLGVRAEEETIEPDADGNCPAGYDKGEDGKCHLRTDQSKKNETVEPDADGNCADGYEKGEDGKCHLRSSDRAARAQAPAGAADVLEVIRLCREGNSQDLVESLIGAKASIATVKARIATARQIRTLCATAKQDDLAGDYIAAGVSVDFVRAQLTKFTAKLDRVEIDAALPPDKHTGVEDRATAGASLNPIDVHRQRNERALAAKGAVRS